MKTTKQLGIWMDHSIAHVMELTNQTIESSTIEAQSMDQDDEVNWKDETLMQHKAQSYLSDYFKRLSNIIKDYDEILLFGPTDAKGELFNLIDSDRHFDRIKIAIRTADKMTEKQQKAFVKEYFETAKQML